MVNINWLIVSPMKTHFQPNTFHDWQCKPLSLICFKSHSESHFETDISVIKSISREKIYTPFPKKIVPFFFLFFSRCPVCGEWCKLHWLLLDTPSFDWNNVCYHSSTQLSATVWGRSAGHYKNSIKPCLCVFHSTKCLLLFGGRHLENFVPTGTAGISIKTRSI
jgi:hypothetical protein